MNACREGTCHHIADALAERAAGIITVQGGVVLAAPPNTMLWDWDNWDAADLEHKIEMFVSLMIGTPALGGPDEKLAMGVLEGAAQRVVALFVAHNEGS